MSNFMNILLKYFTVYKYIRTFNGFQNLFRFDNWCVKKFANQHVIKKLSRLCYYETIQLSLIRINISKLDASLNR